MIHSFMLYMNELVNKEQGGKQPFLTIPDQVRPLGVAPVSSPLGGSSDSCLAHNGLNPRAVTHQSCLFYHIRPLSSLKAPWKAQTWHVTLRACSVWRHNALFFRIHSHSSPWSETKDRRICIFMMKIKETLPLI